MGGAEKRGPSGAGPPSRDVAEWIGGQGLGLHHAARAHAEAAREGLSSIGCYIIKGTLCFQTV